MILYNHNTEEQLKMTLDEFVEKFNNLEMSDQIYTIRGSSVERSESVKFEIDGSLLGLEQLQEIIKQGRIYNEAGLQWFGTLNMFLNRFHSLCIQSKNMEDYEPIRAQWHSDNIEQRDRMEEKDEHIIISNFDPGYNFFGG